MTTITLDLPRQIYQKAAQIAKATKRPIEQVLVEWIRPPVKQRGVGAGRGIGGSGSHEHSAIDAGGAFRNDAGRHRAFARTLEPSGAKGTD